MEGSGSISQIFVQAASMPEEPQEELPRGSKLAVAVMNLLASTLS